MVRELEVLLFDDPIGTLSLDHGRLRFTYNAEWLSRHDAVALSQSLPLQTQPFEDHQARPFFAGILPEGQLRTLIARQFNVSTQNDFALLDRLGGECAGAVSLVPSGPQRGSQKTIPRGKSRKARQVPSKRRENVRWLTDKEVLTTIETLPLRPMLAGRDGLRLSLAGAQDKLPVVFDGERIGLPLNGSPSSHILKPNITSLEDTVINEHFCLTLAKTIGIQSANSLILHVSDKSFLLIERYDREIDSKGHRYRLHQEDFCQALGVVPELKYQSEGGPTTQQCFALLRRVTGASAPEILRLLDYIIFNALIGNNDAHAKNFSLLYSGKYPILAPCYDILSTAIYPTLTQKMAMKIGSKYKLNEVQARHWEQFAFSSAINPTQTKKRILDIAKTLPSMARQLSADHRKGFAGQRIVKQIVTLIEKRSELVLIKLARS